MNEEAKTVLAQLMERALNGVDVAVEFSQEQIPDVIQQLLTWHLMESLVLGILLTSLPTAWVYLCYRFRPGQKVNPKESYRRNTKFNFFTDEDNDPDPRIIFVMFATVAAIGSFLGGLGNLLQAVKIIVAPKLYLLEYGASLIK